MRAIVANQMSGDYAAVFKMLGGDLCGNVRMWMATSYWSSVSYSCHLQIIAVLVMTVVLAIWLAAQSPSIVYRRDIGGEMKREIDA